MSKIVLKESIDMFLCPVCNKKMKVFGIKTIACINNHSFDLSRNGYVNLLLGTIKKDYCKNMLQSRNSICSSGFFKPMTEQICAMILKSNQAKYPGRLRILDAGCGEGSHMAQIANDLSHNYSGSVTGFGVDISKDGIQLASRDYPGIVWCVADLARLPFVGKQFEVVLSILSPSNYSEFNRVMSDDGLLIKVVPGSGYLNELRRYFHDGTDKETYSNIKVIEHFRNHFDILDIKQIQYTMPIDKASLLHLVKMTPLSWRATQEKIRDIPGIGIDNISVDLSIIAGGKKKQSR